MLRLQPMLRLCALLSLFCALPLLAQFNASVQGSVQDPSGAAIAGAEVTITNIDTKTVFRAKSDAAGNYRFVALPPGNYSGSGSAQGFTTIETTFSISTAENRNVDFHLTVGSAASTVEVSSQSPLLDTSDSRLQETVDSEVIEALPLPAHNALNALQLTPGVVGLGISTFGSLNTGAFWSNVPSLSANGRGNNSNQYILDGLDVNQATNLGSILIVPNADAIQEIAVQTNTYAVDYGDSSSIQTIVTSKPGTTRYHGFASEFYSFQGLNARGYFGPKPPTRVQPFHANNLSFGVGGPILPVKHQFFFFASVQPFRALQSNGNSVRTYEDPAFVSFAQTAEPNSPTIALLTKYAPSGATTTGVASTAQQVFGATCGITATDNIPCSLPVLDNGVFNSNSYNHSLGWNVRIDKNFNNDRLFGTVFRSTVDTGGPSIRPSFATTSFDSNFSVQGNWLHNFTPNTLNEVIFGYVYIQGTSNKTGLFTVPVVNVTGLPTGFGSGFSDGNFVQDNYHWRDVLTHIHGAHALKFGYEQWFGRDIANFAGAWGQPTFQYNDLISFIQNKPYSESGISYDPVTGKPRAGNYSFNTVTGGAFAEDTWKASRKLTLNYGLRYDNWGNPWATGTSIMTNFHPGAGDTFAQQIASGKLTVQDRLFNHDMNWHFSPRAGVAYDPTGNGNTVIRGGVGLYHDWVTLGTSEVVRANPPNFVLPTFYSNGSTAAPIFGYGTQNSYPFGYPYPAFPGQPLNASGGIVGSQIGIGGVDGNLETPWTLNWSGAIQRQLTKDFVASVGYVGSHGGDQLIFYGNSGSGTFTNDVNLYAGDLTQHLQCTPLSATSGLAANCTGVQTRLNPNFGSISYTYNGTRSNYSAFIGSVKGRFARDIFLTASYTRSRSRDDYSQAFPVEDSLDRWYGPSNYDAPNRVSIGANYQVPTLVKSDGFLKRLTEGFNVSTLTIYQSGTPFTVDTGAALSLARDANGNLSFNPNSGDFNADGNNQDYPNVATYHVNTSRSAYVTGLFGSCGGSNLNGCGPFSFPAIGQQGNEGANQFRNPNYVQYDATIRKITQISDRVNFELRLDYFNLFNRTNLQGVDGNAADGTFGRSTSSLNPRNAQINAKINF